MNILVADKHQIAKYNTNVEKALKLKEKLKDINSLYQSIVEKNKKTLMSKNKKESLYGMFLPDKIMEYVTSEYKGSLTNKIEKKDFKYYFDDEDRVVLTERYSEKNLLEFIFYFYKDKEVNIMRYNVRDDEIVEIERIEHIQEEVRYSKVDVHNGIIPTFVEDIFYIEKDYMIDIYEGYIKYSNREIQIFKNIRRRKLKEENLLVER